MLRAYRSEFIKLRRLSVLLGGLSMSFFSVLTVMVVVLRSVQVPIPDRPGQVPIALLSSNTGLQFLLNHSAGIVPIIAMIMVAANMGAEYSQGTLRNLL